MAEQSAVVVAEIQNPVETPSVVEPGEGQISPFADSATFNAAQRMAKAMSSSELMPAAYRNNIPNCLIAMELANRIGASVMMVAQNLHIIHGRPGWSSSFLIACVNSSKRFTPLRFRYEGEEGRSNWGCRAIAKDREDGQECVGTLVTMQMAAAEGWSTKKGSKWATMPAQMLAYRAAAFWSRIYCPELSLGMQSAEETVDVHGHNELANAMGSLPDELIPKGAAALENAIGLAPKEPIEAEIEPVDASPTMGAPVEGSTSGVLFDTGPRKGR